VGLFFDFDFVVCYTTCMKTFTYVEDYLEVINGDRDPATGKIYGLFDSTSPIVSLARYDVQVLASMSTATQSGRALTDRQAELAVKIILKYQKQLEKLSISVAPVHTPKFRLGLREIDRRRLLYIEDGYAILKFPYETKLIDSIRDLSKLSQGLWRFDTTNKSWKIALTETNVVAAYGFAKNNEFEIDDSLNFYVDKILECESNPYEIKLVYNNNQLCIQNAPATLVEAIDNLCGFEETNIELLVDNASVYGYTIDKTVEEMIVAKHSPRVFNLMASNESKFSPGPNDTVLKDIIEYANATNRYPIYIFEPDLSNQLADNFVNRYFTPDEVITTRDLKNITDIENKKVIHFNKYHSSWSHAIPLLISSQGMMHGGEKTILLQRSKKVVYFATEVYNIRNMQRKS